MPSPTTFSTVPPWSWMALDSSLKCRSRKACTACGARVSASRVKPTMSVNMTARTGGDAEQLPRGVAAQCWKKGATGEFRRDEAEGAAAFGVTNLSDEKSGQFSWELEREMGLTLRPGTAYRVKVTYLTKNDATGGLAVQSTDYKNVASARLDPSPGWRTATVSFQRAEGVPVRLTVDNTAVGEGNTLYFRSVELVELRP